MTCDLFGNQNPIADSIFKDKVLRSVRRNSSELGRRVVSDYKVEPFFSNAGIYLGDVIEAPIGDDRIERIMAKGVKGLYFDARKERIPDHYTFRVLQYRPWDFEKLLKKYEEVKISYSSRSLGTIFGCGVVSAPEDSFTTIWLMAFYEHVFFSVEIKDENGDRLLLSEG